MFVSASTYYSEFNLLVRYVFFYDPVNGLAPFLHLSFRRLPQHDLTSRKIYAAAGEIYAERGAWCVQ